MYDYFVKWISFYPQSCPFPWANVTLRKTEKQYKRMDTHKVNDTDKKYRAEARARARDDTCRVPTLYRLSHGLAESSSWQHSRSRQHLNELIFREQTVRVWVKKKSWVRSDRRKTKTLFGSSAGNSIVLWRGHDFKLSRQVDPRLRPPHYEH